MFGSSENEGWERCKHPATTGARGLRRRGDIIDSSVPARRYCAGGEIGIGATGRPAPGGRFRTLCPAGRSRAREREISMSAFKLVTRFKPAGDQPQAIRQMVEGLEAGLVAPDPARRDRLGQDLHHRQRHRQGAAPDADPRAEQDPGGAAVRRIPRVLSRQRGGVLRLYYDYYQPEAYVPAARHLHREGRLDQRPHRADAPVGHQGAAGAAATRSSWPRCRPIYGLGEPESVPADGPDAAHRATGSTSASCCAGWSSMQYTRNDVDFAARHLPRARRRDRRVSRPSTPSWRVRIELFDDEVETPGGSLTP